MANWLDPNASSPQLTSPIIVGTPPPGLFCQTCQVTGFSFVGNWAPQATPGWEVDWLEEDETELLLLLLIELLDELELDDEELLLELLLELNEEELLLLELDLLELEELLELELELLELSEEEELLEEL